jgi:hypothetical protein
VESPGSKVYSPPAEDEVEISVFGPGFGECILVHLGFGDWIAIDSCLDPETRRSIALSYLEKLCVDPGMALRAVVATHWDDDHVDGLAGLFNSASAAKFVCSSATRSEEFLSILGAWRLSKFLPDGSGVDEFDEIMKEVGRRSNGSHYPCPVYAREGKPIWERTSTPSAEVRALSPSDAAETAALARLSALSVGRDQLRRQIPRIEDNHASVVLSVRIGCTYILLGGDLQYRADRALGWLAVVDGNEGREPHEAYKIPHHGSENADHDEIWSKLLCSAPVAVTTPWIHGGKCLPRFEDCQRILKRTSRAYITAPPAAKKFRDPNKTVEKTMREAARRVQLTPGHFGHIRLRKNISAQSGTDWSVKLFGDAMHMTQMSSM